MADSVSYPAQGTTVNYVQPQYYTDTGTQFAGGVQDLLGDNGYINDIANNWYNTQPGQGALGQYSTWNQQQQNQFMNPYVTNVANEQARLSNQNLFESILPQVNSTFTGAGQFGSTRNADFTNRAIRDQQYNLSGQQANTLFNAQNQAATQYKDWTQMGNQASQQDFTNWLQQANYPVSSLAQVGQMFQNMRSPNAAGISTTGSGPTNLEKVASVLGILNAGLNDTTVNDLLGWIGANFSGN